MLEEDDLFQIREEIKSKFFPEEQTVAFCHTVAQLLYM